MKTNSDQLKDMYALGVAVAGIGLGTVDYVSNSITLDPRAAELFDLPADVPMSRDILHNRIHPDDRDDIDHRVEALLDPHGDDFIEVSHRIVQGNGNIVWVNARKQVTFSDPANGASVAMSGLVAIMDETAHKQSEARIQYLLDELAHRSKNLLTVVQGIARRTFRTGEVEDFPTRFEQRMSGLAHNQDVLVRAQHQHADLLDLITTHLKAFGEVGKARITATGPKIRLKPDVAQALGMAFHELATNASKYGALSSDKGQVRITWHEEDDGVALTWSESGGPTVVAPSRTGFGQTVLREMLASSVRGDVALEYAPTGVQWMVKLPWDAVLR